MATPSFADSVWISIAIRFEATITQTQRVAVARPAGDVRREVPRVDVGDRCDEGGADEGEKAEPRRALEHAFAVVD